jgi:O-antigen/teichoic acid export membrane protein
MIDGRKETEKERLDRNLNELLGELRVALPGVQVLFAFLLAVPFNQRFGETTGFEKDVYYVTLLLTALATAFLIAPSAHHRIEFRRDDKKHIVFLANRLAIIGFGFLALAMTGVVLLVTSFIFSTPAAAVGTAGTAIVLFSLWYVWPFARLRRLGREYGDEPRVPLPEKSERSADGEGSRSQREGRQAVRGPAQEGHEQEPRGRHRE